jgi:hypothetical protein
MCFTGKWRTTICQLTLFVSWLDKYARLHVTTILFWVIYVNGMLCGKWSVNNLLVFRLLWAEDNYIYLEIPEVQD